MNTHSESWIDRATELSTPFLLVDEQIALNNLSKIAEYAKQHQIKLRPHTKTHKSKYWGKHQIDLGATGLTVAKPGEAEVMSEVCDDLLMAYPAVDPIAANRLAAVANKVSLRVGLDSLKAIETLGQAAKENDAEIGILIDCDLGFHRTGVQTAAESLTLAQAVEQESSLRLDGIMFFPGDVSGNESLQKNTIDQQNLKLDEIVELWKQNGLSVNIVSGGSTPSALSSHYYRHLTEIRPGTSIYNDCNTFRGEYCSISDCAARIITTVISNAVPGKAVVDAGTKTLTSDKCGPALESGHGHVCEYPAAKIVRLSEEHGEIDFSDCDSSPEVGDRLTIIPNHICPCVNLQDSFFIYTSNAELKQMSVDARGKLT